MQITKTGLDEIDWNCSFGVVGEAELPLCEQFKGGGYVSPGCNAATYVHIYGVIIQVYMHTDNSKGVFQVTQDQRANDSCW